MKLSQLSLEAQDGIRRFCTEVFRDPDALDELTDDADAWCKLWFVLRVAPDTPEWFPKGKSATLQFIEGVLLQEAKDVIEIAADHV
jgi:hypothetical protein